MTILLKNKNLTKSLFQKAGISALFEREKSDF